MRRGGIFFLAGWGWGAFSPSTTPHSLLVSVEQSSSQVSHHLQPSSPLLAATDLLHICCWSCYKYAAGAVTDLLLELLSKLLAAACRSAPVPDSPLLAALHWAGPPLLAALHWAGPPLLAALHCARPPLLAALYRTPLIKYSHITCYDLNIEAMMDFLTGGAGYIGSHAALQLLKDSYRVTIVDNLSLHCTALCWTPLYAGQSFLG
ncbi:hypothetical protein SLEP1_g10524 [Rubroshorea leprosula]|uniref:Uncharacterized protein n=1 Tax=Rubroshorea leprosula TaxID=152421 RepID=A0AAV5IJP6_9ROSI|nr:hypothetical protein SLEP1_g10524 [Rubroshorea leprosula]